MIKKQMREAFGIFILIIFIVFTMIVVGCTLLKAPEPKLHEVTSDFQSQKIPFSEALRAATSHDYGGEPISQNVTLRLIRGINVSADGMADIWLLGIVSDNNGSMYSYSRMKVSKIPWLEGFDNFPIINPNDIIYPEKLFFLHPILIKDIISKYPSGVPELLLINQSYVARTGSIGSGKEFKFSSTSGQIQDK